MFERFDGKESVWDEVEFVGVRASTVKGDKPHFTLGQLEYVDNIKSLAPGATFSQFALARASLAWLGLTRPDLCCGINQVAQVSESMFDAAAIKTLKGLVKHAKARRELVLRYPKLDRSTLHLRVYSDSSFANNCDQSSQIGYVIMLCDESGQAHVLSFVSRKCRRVVRSVMAGEVYAFSAAFDEVVRHSLRPGAAIRLPHPAITIYRLEAAI